MRYLTCLAAAAVPLLAATTAWGQESRSRDIEEAFADWLQTGNVVGLVTVLLIFGTGMIFALGWAIAAIVAALRGQPTSADDASARLDGLEARIATIERAIANRQA